MSGGFKVPSVDTQSVKTICVKEGVSSAPFMMPVLQEQLPQLWQSEEGGVFAPTTVSPLYPTRVAFG